MTSFMLLIGGALVAYGAWMAWGPAGPIVAGLLLTAGVLFRATRARR